MKKKHLYNVGFFILVILFFAASSCSKPKMLSNNSTNFADTTITDTTIFIDITLEGKRTLGIMNLNSGSQWGQIWPGAPGTTGDSSVYTDNRIGAVFSGSNQETPAGPIFMFTKGNDAGTASFGPANTYPSVIFLNIFFASGNYNYSTKGSDTSFIQISNGITYTRHLLKDGISLAWIDTTGNLWTTFNGSADQTGSSFVITKSEIPSTLSWGNLAIVTASFNCKLYDKNGNVLHLINGRFRQPIYY